jgi:S1-C subfamily serine protease
MRVRQISILTFTIVVTSVMCGQSMASDDILRSMEEEFTKIVEDVSPAIVEIKAAKSSSIRQSRSSAIREDIGTGIIIDRKGHIVTTESVVGGADKIGVTLADGRAFEAEIVGTDRETDIALIKVVDVEDLPAVLLGDSDNVRSGSWVITIGRSYGKCPTVSFGIVSGVEPVPGRPAYYDAIKINASVSPGNSGGGVIDMNGKVVGIITAAAAEPRAIDFAPLSPGTLRIPELPELRVPDLPELPKLEVPEVQPFLPPDVYRDEWSKIEGLREEMMETQEQLEQELKAHLESVKEMSEQRMRKLEDEGYPEDIKQTAEDISKQLAEDISKQWAQVGREYSEIAKQMAEINKQLAQKQKELAINARDMAEMSRQWATQIQKNRSEMIKEVAEASRQIAQRQKELVKNAIERAMPRGRFFGRREESFAIPINFAKTVIDDLMEDGEIDRGWLGIAIRTVKYVDMERLGLDTTDGVIVTEVIDNSPAARAEIRKGDVIISFGREKVKNPTDFVRMVAATEPHAGVDISIIRDKQEHTVDVEMGKRPE